jgi:hypothetical protein
VGAAIASVEDGTVTHATQPGQAARVLRRQSVNVLGTACRLLPRALHVVVSCSVLQQNREQHSSLKMLHWWGSRALTAHRAKVRLRRLAVASDIVTDKPH